MVNTQNLINFAKNLGAKDRLPIHQILASKQTKLECHFRAISIPDTKEKIDNDWCVIEDYQARWPNVGDYFEQWLKNPSKMKALAIWITMCDPTTKEDVLLACYKRLQQPSDIAKSRDSTLVWVLRSIAWIPQIDDKSIITFVIPSKASRERLPKKFEYNDHNGWLSAIQFGKEERDQIAAWNRQNSEQNPTDQVKNSTALEFGFESAVEAEEIARLTKEIGIDELRSIALRKKQYEFPNDSLAYSDRRQEKVLEISADAPDKESVIRERSIQVGLAQIKEKAKAYLYPSYQNDAHELFCQCCQKVMPFKLKSGEYYFEAVICLKDLQKHHRENYLALCPNCAAMYQYARETSEDEIRTNIIENSPSEEGSPLQIPVLLADEQHSIRFTHFHWRDLQIILRNS